MAATLLTLLTGPLATEVSPLLRPDQTKFSDFSLSVTTRQSDDVQRARWIVLLTFVRAHLSGDLVAQWATSFKEALRLLSAELPKLMIV